MSENETVETKSDLHAEIDGAVDAAMTEIRGKDDERDVKPENDEPAEEPEDPEADEAPAEDEDTEEPEADEQPDGISSAALERAVRAGIPLEEAKQYPTEALLTNMVARIEGSKAGEPGSHADAGSDDQTGQGDGSDGEGDLLSAIPDLNPEDYDENLVAVVNGLKGIIQRQQETIGQLKGAKSEDWLSGKLDGVKDFTKGDAEKTAKVKAKFSVLKAGYKAAGEDVTDDEVFDEAAKLVLGDDMHAAKNQRKGQAARRRNGQFMARPTSSRVEAKPDVTAEVASMIDEKFGT